MKQKISALFLSPGLRQSAMMAVGNTAASGFSAISLIILSRYLGPEGFGGFSVAFALTFLVARIADMGTSTALQRYVAAHHRPEPQDALRAINRIGYYRLAVALTSVVAGLIAGPVLAVKFFHVSDPRLISSGVILAGIIILYEFILAIAQSLSKFALAVSMNAIQAVIKCLTAIAGLLLLAPNPVIAYLFYGSAPLAAAVVGGFGIKSWLKKLPVNRAVDRELVKYAGFGAIGVIALAIGDNIDTLMVNAYLDEYQTGLYSAAARVALMVVMFGASFGAVFNIRAAQYRNPADLKAFLRKSLLFALGSLLLVPLLIPLSKPLLILTAGSQYLEAVPVLNYLMVAALLTMAVMPYIAVFYAVDFPVYFAMAGILQMITVIGFNALFIPRVGIEGAGLAKLIARMVVALYTFTAAYIQAHQQYQTGSPLTVIRQLFTRKKPVYQPVPPLN